MTKTRGPAFPLRVSKAKAPRSGLLDGALGALGARVAPSKSVTSATVLSSLGGVRILAVVLIRTVPETVWLFRRVFSLELVSPHSEPFTSKPAILETRPPLRAAYMDLKILRFDCLQCGHSNVRRSAPDWSGSMRASTIAVPHSGHGSRTIACNCMLAG